jgi:hypothetical protein
MTFDTLSPRLKNVAVSGLEFCKNRFGRNGLQIHREVHANISWKPTFYLKPHPALILAAEVDEMLYPEILKIAAHDIRHHDFPIEVFIICPLAIYLADKKQTTIKLLKKHGFGIITVDDDGHATQQCPCIPLAQHISEQELESEISGLTPSLKVKFRSAHTIYQTNEGQGLQEAGQLVEAMINSIAKESVRTGICGPSIKAKMAAATIDVLYPLNDFKDHRAALGGARNFVKEYRNVASHAPRSAKQAMEKIRRCRQGFIESIHIAKKLHGVMKSKHFRMTIHLT